MKIRSIPSPQNTIACLSALMEIIMIREGWIGEADSTGIRRDKFVSLRDLEDYIKDNEVIGTAIKYILESGLSTEVLTVLERSSDPPEPANGTGILWLSDGTGKGDDGDIMIAVNVDGTTTYGTLFDYSGGAAW